MSSNSWQTPPPPLSTEDMIIESAKQGIVDCNKNGKIINNNHKAPSRRNMGGRRPKKDSSLSPEEEEKRRVRRERNKLAAARCRRRREDHTSELLSEVEQLESQKRELQIELENLKREKEDAEILLANHRLSCKRQIRDNNVMDVKFVSMTNGTMSFNEKIKTEPVDDVFEDTPSPKR